MKMPISCPRGMVAPIISTSIGNSAPTALPTLSAKSNSRPPSYIRSSAYPASLSTLKIPLFPPKLTDQ